MRWSLRRGIAAGRSVAAAAATPAQRMMGTQPALATKALGGLEVSRVCQQKSYKRALHHVQL